ncbi:MULTISPECIES: phosphonate ABC transporter ATP-binding protein [unclassified Modestobacter]
MANGIQVRGLEMRYRDKQVLRGVDLDVPPGQIVALVGANGAGKSTLLRGLVRLVEPTAGTVRIGDSDVRAAGQRQLRAIRQDVGFVFQHFNLVDRLSAFDNVTHGAISRRGRACALPALAPADVRRESMACLERVGLADLAGRRVDTLSGGQRQRVAIARVLMQQPTVVLADEPVASLDPRSGESVMTLLREIATENGITVVAALHQVDFAVRFTERIIGLRDGRISFDQQAATCPVTELAAVYDERLPVLEQAS